MAAPDSLLNFSSPILCKRCGKNIAKNFLKCEKCKSMFHQSCARVSKGVKVVSDSLINCCGTEIYDSNNEAFFDAVESVSVDNKIDIHIFSYIIRQKDVIIDELQDKIRVLNDHIAILNKFNNFKAELSSLTKPSLVEKPLTDKIVDKKLSTRTQINKPSLSETKKQPSSVLIDNKEQKVKVNEPSQEVNTKQLTAELLNLQSEMKL